MNLDADDVQYLSLNPDTCIWVIRGNETSYRVQGYEVKRHLTCPTFTYDKYYGGIEDDPEELTRW